MFERIQRNGRPKTLLAWLAAGAASLVLVACGGAGAGAGGGAAGVGGSISQVIVLADKTSLPGSDASTSASISVLVKDSANNVVRNQSITATTTDPGVSLIPAATPNLTDATGQAKFTLQAVNGASAKANRAIVVVATAGDRSGSLTIDWVNTRLSMSGPTAVTQGIESEYTIKVVDGSNNGVSDVQVDISFDAGTVTPSVVTTRSGGVATFRVNATTSGTGTISASAGTLNARSTYPVRVLAADQPFFFVTPGESARPAVNTDVPVRVRFQRANTTLAGRQVAIVTTRGGFVVGAPTDPLVQSVTVTTDASGEATATLRSANAGPATLSAIITPAPGEAQLSTSRALSFRSNVAAKVFVSADVASIPTNDVGSSNSTNRLRATVRDATDNPVSDVIVAFSAVDPSGGRIEPGLGVTDENGQVTASFVAGPASTGQQGVVVTATVIGQNLSAQTRFTVTAEPLFVQLGTGNTIRVRDDTTYEMPWSAIVTDANRNPVVGARVTASLTAISYFKGVWVYAGAWVPRRADNIAVAPIQCATEDLSDPSTRRPNNLLDAGEDRNGNGILDPGSPASVLITASGGKTGEDGRATLSIVYPKSFGSWAEVLLTVTIATPGSESTISRGFVLPVISDDVKELDKAPPNVGAVLSATQAAAIRDYDQATTNVPAPAAALAGMRIGPFGFGGFRQRDGNGALVPSPDFPTLNFCTQAE